MMNHLLNQGPSGQALQHGNTAMAAHMNDWKAQVIATYQQHRQSEGSALRRALAQQVRALTGHEVNEGAIWVDLDERIALATVDGVRFRWEHAQLVILRACALCGSGQFASPPLTSQADVGYALSAWQPRHPRCQPDDPVDW
jgi:hypothetical protein